MKTVRKLRMNIHYWLPFLFKTIGPLPDIVLKKSFLFIYLFIYFFFFFFFLKKKKKKKKK